MADYITVKPTEKAGQRVVLWEVDEAHPGGEVFIAYDPDPKHKDATFQVGETPAVQQRIASGLLARVGKAKE